MTPTSRHWRRGCRSWPATSEEDPAAWDATGSFADELGVTVAEFVEALGAGWRLLPREHTYEILVHELGRRVGAWFVAGDPFQLALRLDGGGVGLGVPVARWAGHQPAWGVEHLHTLAGTGPELLVAAPPVVARLLERRRSSFRYCRYCRSLTPPESRSERDVCMSCASRWLGVVY